VAVHEAATDRPTVAAKGIVAGTRHAMGILFLAGLTVVVLLWLGSGPAQAASPDKGGKIAFSSNRDDPFGNFHIFAMNADGSCQTRLTNDSAFSELSPSWSPDGQSIAFQRSLSWGSPPGGDIWRMNASGANQVNLTNAQAWGGDPAWSPDGLRIAFTNHLDDTRAESDPFRYSGTPRVYLMNPDGGGLLRLTEDYGLDPTWSPDGRRIAFVSKDWNIWMMNADGSDPINLTDSPEFRGVAPSGPAWSPDGETIAFSSTEELTEFDFRGRIYAMNADGSGLTPLVETVQGRLDDPAWSPDGRIAFHKDGGLWLMNADGTGQQRVIKEFDGLEVDWHPALLPPRSQVCFEALRRNTKKGTARLTVRIPGPGTVLLRRGRGVRQFAAVHEAETPARVVLRVRPRGRAERRLERAGRSQRQARARVRARVTFNPEVGEPLTKGRRIWLVRVGRR
jgi:dipeptidyl aminopeptidase/acylaminoacyl peptidase